MDILTLKIVPEKKDFFLELLKEFSFVTIEDSYTEAEEKFYIEAVLESEENIKNEEVFTQTEMEQKIQTWRTHTK